MGEVEKEKYTFQSASYFFGAKPGEKKCFFCGNSCDESYLTRDYVKNTFTNHDIVKCPASEYVCLGCTISTGMGQPGFDMIDGNYKEATTSRGGAPRLYSWVLTSCYRRAATKGHLGHLRDIMLAPPDPPFSIILADSGKKQIIFRCPIARSKNQYPVQLEEELVIIDRLQLRRCLDVADMFSAACGKIALGNPEDQQVATSIYNHYRDTKVFEKWLEMYGTPISRVAAWLAKPKKEAEIVYPRVEPRGVPSNDGGDNRKKEKKQNRPRNDRNMRQFSIFDAPFLRGRSGSKNNVD